jgi:hypothetical protein
MCLETLRKDLLTNRRLTDQFNDAKKEAECVMRGGINGGFNNEGCVHPNAVNAVNTVPRQTYIFLLQFNYQLHSVQSNLIFRN